MILIFKAAIKAKIMNEREITGSLFQYLSNDHDRLDDLLEHAVENPEKIDMELYAEFRKGMLRHIGIEEKIVLPAIARLQNGEQAVIANRLRFDHGALVALLVPLPTSEIVATLHSILEFHNTLEENPDGLYQLLERLTGAEAGDLLAKLKTAPEVPVLPYNESPGILDVTRRAVERAGYKPGF